MAISPDLHAGGGSDLWGAFIRSAQGPDPAQEQDRDQPRHADAALPPPQSILRKVRLHCQLARTLTHGYGVDALQLTTVATTYMAGDCATLQETNRYVLSAV